MSRSLRRFLIRDEHESNQNLRGHTAGFVTRLIAFLIDLTLVTVISTATAAVFVVLLGLINIDVANCPPLEPTIFSLGWVCYGFLVSAPIVNAVFVFSYHFFFWWLVGKTPGKALIGIKIVPLSGERHMTFFATLRRVVGYAVSLAPLGLGFGWILLDSQRQSWADKVANTAVIYDWDARFYDGVWLGRRHAKQIIDAPSDSLPAETESNEPIAETKHI